MEQVIVIVALIAFIAFRQWIAHQRRVLVHQERMLAIEKGVDLPPLEQEARHRNLNVQRILLLAGLIWIAIGAGAYATLTAMLSYPQHDHELMPGVQYIGLAVAGVGIAHVVVYLIGRNKAA